MTEFDSTPETVLRLTTLVTEYGLSELTVEAGGVRIAIRAERESVPAVLPVSAPPSLALIASPAAAAPPAAASPPAAGRLLNAVPLESPMVGVFYRSPSPDDPPFVVVGDIVNVGQPIGLIEAMKVFSEVPAEVAGRVVETPVESGKLVQQGQPLIYIEPV